MEKRSDEIAFSAGIRGLKRPVPLCLAAALLLSACSAEPERAGNEETPPGREEAPPTTSREEPKSPTHTASAIPAARTVTQGMRDRARTAIATAAPGADPLGPPRVTLNDPNDWTFGGNNIGGNPLPQFVRLGTNNNVPVEIEVNDSRAMRFEYSSSIDFGAAPNVIAGPTSNVVNGGATFYGNTIAGGVQNVITNGTGATVGGGIDNAAAAECSTLAGGAHNDATGMGATVGGGGYNLASGNFGTVPGGEFNKATGHYSFAGGTLLQMDTDYAVALGICNMPQGLGHKGWRGSDPLLVVGNGTPADGFCNTSNNAMTVRKDGNIILSSGPSQVNARVQIMADSNTTGVYSHLHLHETQVNDLTRMSFTNANSDRQWMMTAYPQSTPGNSMFGLWYITPGTSSNNVFKVSGNGRLWLNEFAVGTSSGALCAETSSGSSWIGRCSSSQRYKTNIETFQPGLEIVEKLRSVSFVSKATGERDLGFIAEEVAKVHPLLANYDEQGRPEGVRYMELTSVLSNAIQQQQQTIRTQERELSEQRNRLAKLEALVDKQARLLDESIRAVGDLKKAATATRASRMR